MCVCCKSEIYSVTTIRTNVKQGGEHYMVIFCSDRATLSRGSSCGLAMG